MTGSLGKANRLVQDKEEQAGSGTFLLPPLCGAWACVRLSPLPCLSHVYTVVHNMVSKPLTRPRVLVSMPPLVSVSLTHRKTDVWLSECTVIAYALASCAPWAVYMPRFASVWVRSASVELARGEHPRGH